MATRGRAAGYVCGICQESEGLHYCNHSKLRKVLGYSRRVALIHFCRDYKSQADSVEKQILNRSNGRCESREPVSLSSSNQCIIRFSSRTFDIKRTVYTLSFIWQIFFFSSKKKLSAYDEEMKDVEVQHFQTTKRNLRIQKQVKTLSPYNSNVYFHSFHK